ncbi:MAG TPA: hypothetical protein VGQ76_06530 [Thermoanaerobaculia bacterium]|jgi:hypothetical protein|nr:hypothetical protein [Thermoanaerobaculia bacterium]
MLEQGTLVTTDRFEATKPGEHFINDRCFGEDFAEWLRERLTPQVTSASEPIQEDWGWVLLAELEGSCFTITIAVLDEWIGHVPSQWRVGVAYERSQNFRRLFRKAPLEQFNAMVSRVAGILESEPGMVVGPEGSPGV